MSKHGTYLDGDWVHLDDAHGHHTSIPARVAHVMLLTAQHNRDENGKGRAIWALRPFDETALAEAVDLLDHRDLCDQCHEEPGTYDMGDGKTFCPACMQGAAGSRYDDRIEF